MSFTFKKFEKIKRKKDFDYVFENGFFYRKLYSFTVVYLSTNKNYSRIGIIVKKKHGCAVKRNYEKRVLKELFRTNKNNLINSFDIILLTKSLSSFDQKKKDFENMITFIQDS